MITLEAPLREPFIPTDADSALAGESSRRLTSLLDAVIHQNNGVARQQALQVQIGSDDEPHEIVEIPISAIRLLTQLLDQMAKGNGVTLQPVHPELTTREAAELLGVSRPYMVKLLEDGCIPFREVGTGRRVLFEDLLAYKHRIDEQRRAVLDELAAQAQELNMGY